MGMIDIRRMIMSSGLSYMRLPNAYQKVEYIESGDKDTYILTDCIVGKNPSVKWKFSFVNETPNTEKCLFGWLGNGTEQGFYADFFGNKFFGAVLRARYMGRITITPNTIYECSMDNVKLSIGNNTQSADYTGIENTPNAIAIFCVNKNGELFWKTSPARLYYLRVYENKRIVANFVPCYRKSDNEIGMYDTVASKFYTNNGSGSFGKGKDI